MLMSTAVHCSALVGTVTVVGTVTAVRCRYSQSVPLYPGKPSLLSHVFNSKGRTWNLTPFSSQMFKCLKFWQSFLLTLSPQLRADSMPVQTLSSQPLPDPHTTCWPLMNGLLTCMNGFSLGQGWSSVVEDLPSMQRAMVLIPQQKKETKPKQQKAARHFRTWQKAGYKGYQSRKLKMVCYASKQRMSTQNFYITVC